MSFIYDGKLTTIEPRIKPEQIKISKENLVFAFSHYKITTMAMYIILSINYVGLNIDPKDIYFGDKIDKKSLEDAAKKSIPIKDKEYIKVKEVKLEKVTFEFDYEKWFRKATYGVELKINHSLKKKVLKCKEEMPIMVKIAMDDRFAENISKEFYKYISKNNNRNKIFNILVPKQMMLKYNGIMNLITINYDHKENFFIASVKDEYMLILLYFNTETSKEKLNISNKKLKSNIYTVKKK